MKDVLLSLNFMEHIMVSFYHIRTKVSVAQILLYPNDFYCTQEKYLQMILRLHQFSRTPTLTQCPQKQGVCLCLLTRHRSNI